MHYQHLALLLAAVALPTTHASEQPGKLPVWPETQVLQQDQRGQRMYQEQGIQRSLSRLLTTVRHTLDCVVDVLSPCSPAERRRRVVTLTFGLGNTFLVALEICETHPWYVLLGLVLCVVATYWIGRWACTRAGREEGYTPGNIHNEVSFTALQRSSGIMVAGGLLGGVIASCLGYPVGSERWWYVVCMGPLVVLLIANRPATWYEEMLPLHSHK